MADTVLAAFRILVDLIRAVAWPVVVLLLFLVFQEPLKGFIRKMEWWTWKGPFGEVSGGGSGHWRPIPPPGPGGPVQPALPQPEARLPQAGGQPRYSEISLLYFVPLPVLRGTIAAGIVAFVNTGQADASVQVSHYIWIVDTPSTDQQERLEDERFAAFIAQFPQDSPPVGMSANSQAISMNYGPILTAEMVAGFASGAKTIYFMGALRYRVGQQTVQVEYCRYVTNKGSFSGKRHNGVVTL